jgi:hypothetical protein
MNHTLWNRVGARVAAIAFIIGGLTACGERLADTHAKGPSSNAADASAVVVGTAPAQPSGDPPGTTPVASNTTDLTKQEEISKKPQEGDNHSYSTLSPDTKQKSEGSSPTEKSDPSNGSSPANSK